MTYFFQYRTYHCPPPLPQTFDVWEVTWEVINLISRHLHLSEEFMLDHYEKSFEPRRRPWRGATPYHRDPRIQARAMEKIRLIELRLISSDIFDFSPCAVLEDLQKDGMNIRRFALAVAAMQRQETLAHFDANRQIAARQWAVLVLRFIAIEMGGVFIPVDRTEDCRSKS